MELPRKSIQVINEEIPEEDEDDGDEFGDVEIEPGALSEQVNNEVVEQQAHHSSSQKLGVLPANLRVVAMEGPDAVEVIVAAGSQQETQAVGHILVPAQLLLCQKGYPEVQQQAREANQAKFKKLEKEALYTV